MKRTAILLVAVTITIAGCRLSQPCCSCRYQTSEQAEFPEAAPTPPLDAPTVHAARRSLSDAADLLDQEAWLGQDTGFGQEFGIDTDTGVTNDTWLDEGNGFDQQPEPESSAAGDLDLPPTPTIDLEV